MTIRAIGAAVAYTALVIASMVVDSQALPTIATAATAALLLGAAVAAWLRRGDAAYWFGFALFGSAIYLSGGGDLRLYSHGVPTDLLVARLADLVFFLAGGPGRILEADRIAGAGWAYVPEWREYASGIHLLLSASAGIAGGSLVRALEARQNRLRDRLGWGRPL